MLFARNCVAQVHVLAYRTISVIRTPVVGPNALQTQIAQEIKRALATNA